MMGYGGYGGYQMEQKPSGGGFVNSPAEGTPKDKSSQSHGLRPVTIKQILQAESTIPDGPFYVDGKELSQISFAGRVNEVKVSPSNTQYVIDDGTGIVDVRQYTDAEEGEKDVFPKGFFVRVVGQVKRFNNKKSVTVYKIFRIDSLDELAHHYLTTVVTHLGLTKPKPVQVIHSDQAQAFNANPLQQSFGQVSFSGSHYTPLQQKILQCIAQSSNDVQGSNIRDVIVKLRGMATETQIR